MRVGGARLVGEEQVEVAVVVRVEPAGADRGTRVGGADADEDVRELAAVVAEQLVVAAAIGGVDVEVAVVVVVDPVGLAGRAVRGWSGRSSAATSVNFLPPSLRSTMVSLSVGVEPPSRSMSPSPSKSPQLRPRSSWLPACGMPTCGADAVEHALVVAVEAHLAGAERHREIEVAVVVVVAPGVGEGVGTREQLGLHRCKRTAGRRRQPGRRGRRRGGDDGQASGGCRSWLQLRALLEVGFDLGRVAATARGTRASTAAPADRCGASCRAAASCRSSSGRRP